MLAITSEELEEIDDSILNLCAWQETQGDPQSERIERYDCMEDEA